MSYGHPECHRHCKDEAGWVVPGFETSDRLTGTKTVWYLERADTHINETELRTRRELHKEAKLTWEGTKAIQWGDKSLLNKSPERLHRDLQKKMNLALSLIFYLKINSSWITGWRIKYKTITFRKNVGKKPLGSRVNKQSSQTWDQNMTC